jgi:hypothetical protein
MCGSLLGAPWVLSLLPRIAGLATLLRGTWPQGSGAEGGVLAVAPPHPKLHTCFKYAIARQLHGHISLRGFTVYWGLDNLPPKGVDLEPYANTWRMKPT